MDSDVESLGEGKIEVEEKGKLEVRDGGPSDSQVESSVKDDECLEKLREHQFKRGDAILSRYVSIRLYEMDSVSTNSPRPQTGSPRRTLRTMSWATSWIGQRKTPRRDTSTSKTPKVNTSRMRTGSYIGQRAVSRARRSSEALDKGVLGKFVGFY